MVDIIDSVQLEEVSSAVLDLFEIITDSGTLFFYAGLEAGTDTVWFPSPDGAANNEYIAIPLELTGIDISADGASSRPTLTIANVINAASGSGADTTMQDEYLGLGELSNEAFVGKRLVRRRTLAEHLVLSTDIPTGTPPSEFPPASFVIDRISSENNVVVSFELASPLDVEGLKIPSRIVVGKFCSWQYQGLTSTPPKGGCPWKQDSTLLNTTGVGTAVASQQAFFDINDIPCVANTIGTIVYSGATNYAKDAYVSSGGLKWRSQLDNNQGNTPILGDLNWQVVITWTDYNVSLGYTFIAPPVYTVIRHAGRLWTPKRNVPVGLAPPTTNNTNSAYWRRIDLCGKTVKSCKLRCQFLPVTQNTRTIPSVDLNTEKALPFGGYPGTAKFR